MKTAIQNNRTANAEKNCSGEYSPGKWYAVKNHLSLIVLFFAFMPFSGLMGQTTVTYNTNGTFVVPIGVTSITVQAWGGGGGGASGTGERGGGGGGAYASSVFAVSPLNSFPIIVGSAGGVGNGGGTSSFNTNAVIAAGGSSTASATGGAGGTIAASTGTVRHAGGSGGNGTNFGGGGGGGGSALTTGNGTAGSPGGASAGGNGGPGAGAGGRGGDQDGSPAAVAGTAPGGGGGGRGDNAGASASGAPGRVVITYTQQTYKCSILSINSGANPWCPGETRNVSVTIQNTGTATWSDANPDINIGIKWNTNGTSWTDYFIRVDAGALAPGATAIYTLPLTASNNINGTYGAPLASGTNNIICDVVYEAVSWFGDNNSGVGPGNVKFTSPAITIGNVPTGVSASASPNPICEDGTLNLSGNASGATSWAWTGPNGYLSSSQNNSITNITLAAAGIYTLTASNACGSAVDANTANVIINPKPVVNAGAAVCVGSSITLSPTSGGTWTSSNNAVATVTNAGVVDGVAPGSASFTFTQSGTGCSNTTSVVTVNARPTASINSPAVSICNNGGSTAITGTVTASGNWTITLSDGSTATGTGNGNFSITVSPVITTTYSITSLVDENCSSNGSDLSGSTIVTVNDPVVIVDQPQSAQTICSSFPVSFTVNATGTGLTYQWYLGATPLTDNANINGSNTATLNIVQAGLTDAGAYHVVITGLAPCSPVTSDDAVLTVNQDIEIIDQPTTQVQCAGTTATFTVNAIGSGLSYQWRKGNTPLFDGGRISGASTATLSIANVNAGDAATNYNVVISGSGGVCPQTISADAALIVNPIPNAIATPQNQTACSGVNISNINFSSAVLNTTFNWTRDNPAVTGTILTSGTGNITGNLVNNTNTAILVTFTITPTASGCDGSPITATVLVNPSPDAVPTPASQTICSGGNISTISSTSSVSGANFNWTRDNPGVTGTIGNSGSGNISGTLVNNTANPITVTFSITGTANGCFGPAGTATVLVNPSPVAVATPASQSSCNGSNITTIVLSSATPGTTYSWTRDNPGITGTIGNSGNGNISGSFINSGTAPVTVTFTIVPQADGCDGLPITATVIVNPTPDVSGSPLSQTVCSGTAISTIVFSGSTTGTVFAWTRNNTLTVTGMGNSGAGNISGTLTNTTNLPVTVTFTITPFINGCPGASITADVIVEPKPTVLATPSSQNVCYNSNFNIAVSNPNNVASTTLTWTRDNPPGITTALPLSGTGNISGVVTNTTGVSVTITFTITATAPNTCSSTTTATITLYPELVAPVVSSSQVICSGSNPLPLTATAATGGNGTFTYQWQQGATATGPWLNVGTNSLTYTPPSQAGFYRLVATGICGTVTSNVIQISVGGDTGLTFGGTGAPTSPLCPGSSFTYNIQSSSILGLFGGNYIRYTWSGNTSFINSPTVNPYGTTNTIFFIFTVFNGTATFTVQNATAVPVTTNLVITPVVYNSSGVVVCNLTPTVIPVTINPTASVNTISNQTVCNNSSTAAVNFSGPVAGTTFSWTNNTPSIGLAASGSGNIPSFTATNAGTTAVTATITVTPSYTNGVSCPGTPKTFTITVNPTPVVTLPVPASQTVCNNAATTAINFTANIPGTVINWTNNNTSIGLAASGSGNIGSFIATNAGAVPVTATITVTPSYTIGATTCNGTAKTYTITVNPNVNAGAVSGTSPLCIGATATYTSNGNPGGTWSSTNTAVATVNAASGLVTAVGAGSTDITYTINSGCNSPVSAFKTLTVNPNANAGTVTGLTPLCIGATAGYSSNGDVGGSWSSSNTAVATVNASTGLVTAVSAGTANIIYTVTGCNAVPSSQQVTVSPNANAGVVSGSSPLCPGLTATYSSNGNPGGNWSSSNTSIATVDPVTGLVTAVSPGSVNIIYTVAAGCNSPVSSFKILNVGVNASAGTVTGPSPICIGSSAFYFTSGDPGGSWSSSNPSVATVNASTGFVTGVSAGSTNIIYTVNTGCNSPVSSSKSLTVSPAQPSTPGPITGTTPVCAATAGFIYSISPVANATTYTWSVPAGWTINSGQGTTSINVTTGANSGNVTVTAGNFCGTSAPRIFAVTVRATGTWLGIINHDWENPGNWCGGVPTSTTDVIIPNGTPHDPHVDDPQMANNISIASANDLMIIPGGSLKIFGSITASNNFFAANGTVEMAGATTQTIGANTFQNNALNKLVVNNAAGVIVGGPLNIYGSLTFGLDGTNLTTNDFLTIKSTLSNTAWVGDMTGKTITGKVTVERYIPNHSKAWQFLSVPVKGNQTVNEAWQDTATFVNENRYPGFGTMLTGNVPNAVSLGFDVYTPVGPSIKIYNSTTGGYDGLPNTKTQPVENPFGYMVLVRGDRSVIASNQAATATTLRTKGKLYTPTDPPSVINVGAGKFQSIGNPYASAIDFSAVSKTGGVQTDFFYMWDPRLTTTTGFGGPSAFGLGAFQTFSWNGSGYDVTPGGGSYSGTNRNIESGQAFFVFAPFSAGTVSFSEGSKVSGSNSVNRINRTIGNAVQLRSNLYALNNSGEILIDGNMVQFGDEYSNDVDEYDAIKLNNTGENLGLVRNGKKLAIERRKTVRETDTLYLSLGQVKVQQYQFEFISTNLEQQGVQAYLEDNYLQARTQLSLQDTAKITFNIINEPGSYASDRFRIVFKKLAPVPVTITSISAKRNSDNSIAINWKVENESSMKQYSIERSEEGRNFTGIITTEAKGNNGAATTYSANDLSPLAKDNFYRIKAIGIDGRIQYSAIVKVDPLKAQPSIVVYPNPVIGKLLQLSFSGQEEGRYSLQLVNKLGQQVYNTTLQVSSSSSVHSLPLNNEIAGGAYQVIVTNPGGNKTSMPVIIQ